MKHSEMIRITCQSVACLCMAYVMISCSNGGEAGEKCDSAAIVKVRPILQVALRQSRSHMCRRRKNDSWRISNTL